MLVLLVCIIVCSIGFIISLAVIAYKKAQAGNEFRDNARSIKEGMTYDEVVKIMGVPSLKKQFQDGSYEIVYEKKEWKGELRGGMAVRRMEIIISSANVVISVARNKDCERSGW